MQTRSIGSLKVTNAGLGCNNFGGRLDYAGSEAVVTAALDVGITLFDTADAYGDTNSEVFLGRALGHRRKDVIIATKFGMRVDPDSKGAKPAYVRRALDSSLRRLGTDWIDLYQLHWPDPTTPIADTLAVLDELVHAGKIREIGCSNFSADQLQEARDAAAPGAARFVSVQNEYSLLHREPERDVLAECERLGVAFVPYFPLASGLLTGKYARKADVSPSTRMSQQWTATRFLSQERLATVAALRDFAESHGRSILQLAMTWLLHRSVVASVIAGATTADQVRANVRALESPPLTEAEVLEIDRISASASAFQPLVPPP